MTDDTSSESIFDQLMHSGLEWVSERLTKACPPKKKKRCTEHKKVEEEIDIGPPCTGQPYISPSQICPKMVSCYIKMQDPYAPCCCETKPQPPPCPPKYHRRQLRESTCGCDLCKKEGIRSKCCSSTTAFYDATIDPKYFRRA
nr:PREDICTED: uncharacterized protein LOC105678763 [Linepithema humile]